MDIDTFYSNSDEKPLDNLVTDGGFCGIFRTIGCIGDSLSSGEFESKDENGIVGYHDFYEYSWGQFMARTTGSKVYNFSRGGMTAKEFCENFAEKCGVYNRENLCQAYIIALGVNDIKRGYEIGNPNNYDASLKKEADDESILGYYTQIIKKIRVKQPGAKIFAVTIPCATHKTEERMKRDEELAEAIRKLIAKISNAYVIDLRKYGPIHDEKFNATFRLGHMTPAGYLLMSKLIMSYIDYIIRNNFEDFNQVGFVGTPLSYK